MYLESPNNERVKVWSRLKTKKGRDLYGEFLVEGMRSVKDVLASSLVVSAVLWDVGTDELSQEFLDIIEQRAIPFYEMGPSAFASVSDTVTPQGVIAVVQIPQKAHALKDNEIHAMLLDGVQDPGNVGTLIRSAEAFGIAEVCCGTQTADPYSPKVVRATMGGLFHLSVRSMDSVAYVESWLKKWPHGQVVLTTADADQLCYDADFRTPTLILIGSEATGVSERVRSLANRNVRIPMTGLADSLNAGVAGSVLLYEVFRQLHSASSSGTSGV